MRLTQRLRRRSGPYVAGRHQLELARAFHQCGEVPGLGDVLADEPSELRGAVLLDVHPGLERPEPAGQLHPVVAEPQSSREAALAVHEVIGRERECAPVLLRVAHENDADLVRQVEPLVEVEGERVSALHAGHQGSQFGRQAGQDSERAVDVEPHALTGREVSECRHVVDSPGVHGAGIADEADRPQAEA
jgi:hypothetical protein